MGNVSTVEILEDGARNTALIFYGVLDSGNLAPTVVVNINNQFQESVFGDSIGLYRLDRIEWSVEDPIAIVLMWGGANTVIGSFSGRGYMHLGREYGGIIDAENINVRDGRVLAKSVGYASGTISFSLTMWLVKGALENQTGGNAILMEDGSFILMEDNASHILLE